MASSCCVCLWKCRRPVQAGLAWLVVLQGLGEAKRGNCSCSDAFKREGRRTLWCCCCCCCCYCCGFHCAVGTGRAALWLLLFLFSSKAVVHIVKHLLRVTALRPPYGRGSCSRLAEPTTCCIPVPIPNSNRLVAHGLTRRATPMLPVIHRCRQIKISNGKLCTRA